MNKREYELKRIDTNKPSNLILMVEEKLVIPRKTISKLRDGNHFQLLLALSDEEIKDEDLCLDTELNLIAKRVNKTSDARLCYKKIIASNSKKITPNSLLPDSYTETYAKQFNAGNAPKTVWLEIELINYKESNTIKKLAYYYTLKTSNNFVIVAEQEEKKTIEKMIEELKMYPRKEFDKLMNEMLCEVLLKPAEYYELIQLKKCPSSNSIADYVTEFLNLNLK